MLKSILVHTFESHSRNFAYITFFSVSFLVALAIPLLIPSPTYVALGSIYLRIGSIPTMGFQEAVVIAVGFLASYVLLAIGLVSIAIVVKAQRTLKKVPEEVVKGLQRYVSNVLWIYVAVTLFLIAAGLLLNENGLQFLFPLAQIGAGLYILLVPIAMVIDDISIAKAFGRATDVIKARAVEIGVIMVALLLVVALVYGTMLMLLPHGVAVYLFLVVNGLLLNPFLIMLGIHTYLSKYPLIY